MAERILDHDAMTGVTTYHDYDHTTRKTIIRRSQDVQSIIDQNINLQNDERYKQAGLKNEMMKVASVPIIVQEQWLKEGIDMHNPEHWNAVKRKLNSPEYAYLRTNANWRI